MTKEEVARADPEKLKAAFISELERRGEEGPLTDEHIREVVEGMASIEALTSREGNEMALYNLPEELANSLGLENTYRVTAEDVKKYPLNMFDGSLKEKDKEKSKEGDEGTVEHEKLDLGAEQRYRELQRSRESQACLRGEHEAALGENFYILAMRFDICRHCRAVFVAR